MIRRLRVSVTIWIICLTLLAMPEVVYAFPPLPSSFYGTVKLNSANLPEGTLVQALIGDQVVAFNQTITYQGNSVYSLGIPGDDSSTPTVEGGKEGDTIHFKIGGILASQTGVWHSGTNVNLDLTATSSTPPLPPQPTSIPLPTQTAIRVIPTRIAPTKTRALSIQPTLPSLPAQTQANILPSQVSPTITAITANLPTETPGIATAIQLNVPTETQLATTGLSSLTPTPESTLIRTPTGENSPSMETMETSLLETGTVVSSTTNSSTVNLNYWTIIPAAILLILLFCLTFGLLLLSRWYFRKKR